MHVPVLLVPTIDLLSIGSDDIVLDCTVGFGGHSAEILSREPGVRLIGLDQDAAAIAYSADRLGPNATLLRGNFSDASALLKTINVNSVSKILVDLGISSYQLDRAGRGFSFLKDEPLDLRMNADRGQSASEWLARVPEKVLSDTFYHFGDLIHNKNLVQEIIQFRKRNRLATTDQLVDLVKRSYRFGSRPMMMKTMSQVFQAIRIAVNDEMGVIQKLLAQLPTLLSIGGRIAIISFHSGEDRLIKHHFQAHRDMFTPVVKKVVIADQDEIRLNSRSKPAKLRVYERSP